MTTEFTASPHAPRAPRVGRGLTLPELVLAVAVTGIIAAAAASFAATLGQAWAHNGAEQNVTRVAGLGGSRIEGRLRSALYIARATDGVADGSGRPVLFYWRHDSFGGKADKRAQAGEMALIELDPAAQAVLLYEPPDEAAMDPAMLVAAAADDWDDLTAASAVQAFKDLNLAVPRPLIGGAGGEVAATGGRFDAFYPTGGKPLAVYDLQAERQGRTGTAGGSVMIRSRKEPTNVTN